MTEPTIPVIINGEPRMVVANTTISDILEAQNNRDIVGALLNHDVVGLNTTITTTVKLSPVYYHQREGREILNRTYTHLLESIFARHFDNLHFQIGQALHQGFYYELLDWVGPEPDLDQVAQKLDALVNESIEADLPVKEMVANVESACLLLTDKRGSMLRLLETWPSSYVPIVQLGGFCAIQHGPMAPSTGYCKGIKIVPFPKGIILQFSRNALTPDPAKSRQLVTAYRESREWNRMINVATVADLNSAILEDRIDDVIRVQEGLHEKKFVQIAETIASRRKDLRVICVAGPSSSGKTTFVKRLSVQLKVAGIQPVVIGLDDYYRDRSECPRDASGKMDFEALDALDIPLLTQHLKMLVDGAEIQVPRFDFTTGSRVPESKFQPLRLEKDQMLLIEGIHGLNPVITDSVAPQSRFRIFVSALTQLIIDEHNRIPTSDGRLLRRIVRDRRYRGTPAAGTIEMWPRVKKGEQKWIFPFQEQCDVMFNSAIIYEAAVLKTYAWRYLLEVSREDHSRIQAQSLLRFLDMFLPLEPKSVPSNSVLREFVGGSDFVY